MLANEGTPFTMPVQPAYTNNGNCNGMWGNDWMSFIVLFLIFGMFGGWGNRFGGFGGGQNCCPDVGVQRGFDHSAVITKLDGITQGICDSTYALNNGLNNGFHGVDNAICNLGYQTQQGFSTIGAQMASCCCDTQRAIDHASFQNTQGINGIGSRIDACCCETHRQIERGFCDTNYNLATNTTNIIQNAHNDTDRVIAKLDAMESARQQEKIQALQMENQGLKFAASQAQQNTFITANQEAQTAELIRRLGRDCPTPAFIVPNPNCCYGGNGYGYGSGCGCCA